MGATLAVSEKVDLAGLVPDPKLSPTGIPEIPDAEASSDRQPPAVWGEGSAACFVRETDRLEKSTRLGVPEADRMVKASTRRSAPVVKHLRAVYSIRMPPQNYQIIAARLLPQVSPFPTSEIRPTGTSG